MRCLQHRLLFCLIFCYRHLILSGSFPYPALEVASKRLRRRHRIHAALVSLTFRCHLLFFTCGQQDEAKGSIVSEIADGPVDEDEEFVFYTEDEHEVEEHPCEPCQPALEAEFGKIDHGFVLAYGGHGAGV